MEQTLRKLDADTRDLPASTSTAEAFVLPKPSGRSMPAWMRWGLWGSLGVAALYAGLRGIGWPVATVAPVAPVLAHHPAALSEAELRLVQAEVQLALTQWAKDWSRRDVAAYLGWYGADFKVPAGLSPSAWQTQRKTRINQARRIKVELKNIVVSAQSPDHATVHLLQHYKADNYRPHSTAKELQLKKEKGRWRILAEKPVQPT